MYCAYWCDLHLIQGQGHWPPEVTKIALFPRLPPVLFWRGTDNWWVTTIVRDAVYIFLGPHLWISAAVGGHVTSKFVKCWHHQNPSCILSARCLTLDWYCRWAATNRAFASTSVKLQILLPAVLCYIADSDCPKWSSIITGYEQPHFGKCCCYTDNIMRWRISSTCEYKQPTVVILLVANITYTHICWKNLNTGTCVFLGIDYIPLQSVFCMCQSHTLLRLTCHHQCPCDGVCEHSWEKYIVVTVLSS